MTYSTAQELSALIGLIYDAALDGRRWPVFLEALASAFESSQAMLLTIDAEPDEDSVAITKGLDLGVISQWEGCKEHTDLWYRAIADGHRAEAYRGTEMVPRSRLHRSGFHADILRPLDIEYTLGGIVPESRNRQWVFAVYRDERMGNYTRRDAELYRLLTPHMRRALDVGRRFGDAAQTEAVLRGAIDAVPFGVMILRRGRVVVHANAEAERILAEGDGLTTRRGRLEFADSRCRARIERLARGDDGPSGQRRRFPRILKVTRPSGRRSYHLLAWPVGAGSEPASPFPGSACLLLVHDPTRAGSLSASVLRRLYGLTPAEARLCVSLFETGSLAATLEQLEIGRNTAKTHLSHVYDKLGVSSQAQLVKKLALGLSNARTDRDR